LLNPKDFNVKRRCVLLMSLKEIANCLRWDDDVVFKNQARGTEDKKPKEFVNDLLRSDFHKRFMVSRAMYRIAVDANPSIESIRPVK
jgi:protein CWC15